MDSVSLYQSLKTVCAGRRSVRRFSGHPLSTDQISKIREIALLSPYASGKKNWDLLVVTDPAQIRELAELVKSRCSEIGADVREDFRGMFMDYAVNFSAFQTAPALFIPTFKVQRSLSFMLGDPGEEIMRWERDNYVKSISCVAMLVLLAAESLGLGSCCMTGPLLAGNEFAGIVGVKKGYEVGSVVPVGYLPEGDAKA